MMGSLAPSFHLQHSIRALDGSPKAAIRNPSRSSGRGQSLALTWIHLIPKGLMAKMSNGPIEAADRIHRYPAADSFAMVFCSRRLPFRLHFTAYRLQGAMVDLLGAATAGAD